jgi:hypothetical protein
MLMVMRELFGSLVFLIVGVARLFAIGGKIEEIRKKKKEQDALIP